MARGVWTVAAGLVAGRLLGAAPVGATVLVPMSDEDLIATSDVIVVGRVGAITTAALDGGGIVTRITLTVERALKGAAAGGSLVVTELGGQIGGRAVVVLGSPEYASGERVLAFLRRRADGSLETNALALGKYHVAPDAGGVPLARRTVPQVDERPRAAFLARIAALAPHGAPRSDGRAGIGIAPPVLETKKQRKLLGKALVALEKTDRAIAKKVPGDCGAGMRAIVADLRTRATTARDGIQ